jgi:putative membrane protein PagO
MRIPAPLAFAACAFIWGTTWLAIKFGYGGLDAVWGASLRFLAAGLIMAPMAWALGQKFPKGRRQVGVVVFVGMMMFAIDYGFIYWGEQFISSGLTAILFATMPLFIGILNALVIPNEKLTRRHGAGIVVGLAGLLLVFQQELGFANASLAGMAAILLAAWAAAATSVVVRRWGRDLAPMTLNSTAMVIGGSALLVAALLLGETPSAPRTTNAWLSLAYLIGLGSIVAFLLYWDLLKKWGANRAGLIPIITPVIAVTTGTLAGEHLSTLQWVGSGIVLLGVAIALAPLRFPLRSDATAPSTGK